MGKSTISMAMFNSFVKLPEVKCNYCPIIYSLYPHEYSNGIYVYQRVSFNSGACNGQHVTLIWWQLVWNWEEFQQSIAYFQRRRAESGSFLFAIHVYIYIYISYTYRGKQCKFKNHPPHTARVDRFHQPHWSHTCSALQLPGIQKKSHWDKPQNKTKIQTKSSHRSWV